MFGYTPLVKFHDTIDISNTIDISKVKGLERRGVILTSLFQNVNDVTVSSLRTLSSL